jgi:hypothetical protein
MATVYRRVNGEKVQRLVARTMEVQTSLEEHALVIGAKAEALMHHHSGNSFISVDKGDIDRYVTLNDPPSGDSPGAAMSIEFGHWSGKGKDRKWVEGTFPIHNAAGLPHA